MKKINILITLLMLNTCFSQSICLSLTGNYCQNDTIQGRACLKKNLLNCMGKYIDSYDTIQHSWGVTPIYLISFYLEGKDTIVHISGQKVRPLICLPPDNKGLELVGYFLYKNKPIVIYDNKNKLGNCLYESTKLSKNIEIIDKGRDIRDFERNRLPEWIYVVENKAHLRLIRKEKGWIMK